jgi:hypothetical protein
MLDDATVPEDARVQTDELPLDDLIVSGGRCAESYGIARTCGTARRIDRAERCIIARRFDRDIATKVKSESIIGYYYITSNAAAAAAVSPRFACRSMLALRINTVDDILAKRMARTPAPD